MAISPSVEVPERSNLLPASSIFAFALPIPGASRRKKPSCVRASPAYTGETGVAMVNETKVRASTTLEIRFIESLRSRVRQA